MEQRLCPKTKIAHLIFNHFFVERYAWTKIVVMQKKGPFFPPPTYL